MELENLGQGGRAADLSNGLPGQGRPEELPSGRMPRLGGDEDGDAGSLPIPEYPGHCIHSGRGKPPPPTVHLMQYYGPRRELNGRHPATSQCARGVD